MEVSVDYYITICECGSYGVGLTEAKADDCCEGVCCDKFVARVNQFGDINLIEEEEERPDPEVFHNHLPDAEVTLPPRRKTIQVETIGKITTEAVSLDEAEELLK